MIFGVLVATLVGCADERSDFRGSTTAMVTSSTTTTPAVVRETASIGSTTSTAPPPFQVLVFHKTTGFRHDSIPAGIVAITELGQEYGFAVTPTADASVFTDSGLAGYAVIVFLSTTGDVLDGQQERALERFIADGNGFVGIHSAADTEYEWPWYGSLIGAYFDSHPAPQQAIIQVVEPQHPTMQGLPRSFVRFDEWYNFRNQPDPEVMILVSLDESSYEGGTMSEPHPIVWARQYEEGGRSFYTGFGHTVESFSESLVLIQLVNAVLWAAHLD
jgi:cytochrome c